LGEVTAKDSRSGTFSTSGIRKVCRNRDRHVVVNLCKFPE
jgi:hypothetical protein